MINITVDSLPITVSPTTVSPDPVVTQPYSLTFTASGGTAPYTWSIASGTLPPGITLSASGVLSGTPTQAGVFSVGILVKDSAGSQKLL